MRAGIHPTWYPQAQVTCACGNTFTAGSTKPTIAVEICAQCHPYFTGEMKFVDTLGRVERFQKRQQAVAGSGKHVSKKAKKQLKQRAEEEKEAKRPKSLKEMLDRVRSASSH